MMRTLKTGGVLSISLPTDPGIIWRLGRKFIKYFTLKKTYRISGDEFEYMNATEHVNSIFNLISIIKFNYKNSIEEHYHPFLIKSADINLFYNVHIFIKTKFFKFIFLLSIKKVFTVSKVSLSNDFPNFSILSIIDGGTVIN